MVIGTKDPLQLLCSFDQGLSAQMSEEDQAVLKPKPIG
jgi:hypothetical protein